MKNLLEHPRLLTIMLILFSTACPFAGPDFLKQDFLASMARKFTIMAASIYVFITLDFPIRQIGPGFGKRVRA